MYSEFCGLLCPNDSHCRSQSIFPGGLKEEPACHYFFLVCRLTVAVLLHNSCWLYLWPKSFLYRGRLRPLGLHFLLYLPCLPRLLRFRFGAFWMTAIGSDRVAVSAVTGGGGSGCRVRALSVNPYDRTKIGFNSTGNELTRVAVTSES